MRNLAENACLQNHPGGKNLAFPAPIMKTESIRLYCPAISAGLRA